MAGTDREGDEGMGRDGLAARRRAQGLSQEGLAWRLGHDPTTVRRWEGGRTTPQPQHRGPLADALGISLADLDTLLANPDTPSPAAPPSASHLGLVGEWPAGVGELADAVLDGEPVTAEAAGRLVHAWLVTDAPQLVEQHAGRRVGMRLAATVARRVERLRRLDDHLAGTDLQAAIARELDATVALVRDATYRDEVGRHLLAALGDLCQLAGWAAADANQPDTAAHHYAAGITAAHAAGDRPLAGQLTSSLAYQLTNTGRPADGVLLAQSALAGTATAATATTRALFYDRLAWAHANSGDRRQAERALGQAEDAFADRCPGDDPSWAYWLDTAELEVMAGRCYVALNDPDRARRHLDGAVTGYGEDRPREAALYWSWLAEAELHRGDIDEAATLAARALELATHTASTRTTQRTEHLAHLLNPHRGHPHVDTFIDHYHSTLT